MLRLISVNAITHVVIMQSDKTFLYVSRYIVKMFTYNFLHFCEMVSMSLYLSHVVRNPTFCICKNKDSDQLRGKREADQRLYFVTWIVQSLYFLDLKFQTSSHLKWLYNLVVSDLVRVLIVGFLTLRLIYLKWRIKSFVYCNMTVNPKGTYGLWNFLLYMFKSILLTCQF